MIICNLDLKKIFIILVIIFVFSFGVFSGEYPDTHYNTGRAFSIAGFSTYYTGIALELLVGLPITLIGSFTGNMAVMAVGMPFYIIGAILELYVGPILSIVGYYNLVQSDYISLNDRVEINSAFWYGMGWASQISCTIPLFVFLVTGRVYNPGIIAGIVIYAIGAITACSFRGVSVTVPFVNLKF